MDSRGGQIKWNNVDLGENCFNVSFAPQPAL